MSDEAVKHRRRRAIRAAIKILEQDGFDVTRLHHPIYDLAGEQPKIVRKIKICLDKILPSEFKDIQQNGDNAIHSREIWIYKSSPGKGFFDIKFI